MFALISPFSRSFDDIWFTYKTPKHLEKILKIGMVVSIPFGKNEVYWVVLDTMEQSDFDETKIKEITTLYSEDIFLNTYQIALLRWISIYYFCLIHQSVWLFFPKNLIEKIEKNTFTFSSSNPLSYTFQSHVELSIPQKAIYETILSTQKNKFLLYWVTGSGKTEIYIHLIKHYLDLWKQSLLLVPEIILTNQIFERITKVFWREVLILNSTVSAAKKTKYWQSIHQNQAKVIIWTRSALFYPYNNLGIIIIDEEHDQSYISDNAPRYDSIEVAEKIVEWTDVKLLLWSGTPKIHHLYRWLKWEFEVLHLFQEYK